ncbi:MAG: succinate dehydrogenase, cytochrome b556 subunit [Thiobacillus sp.]
MSRDTRPVYLDLLRIHLPLPGWVSILHRVSGALLFLALPLGVWALSASLSSEAGFRAMAGAAGSVAGKLLLVGLTWAFSHHLFAGLRHLALDAHCGTSWAQARRSSLAVLTASAAVTLAVAWRLLA